jgi:hypothetical protein
MRTLFLLILATAPVVYPQKKAPAPKPPVIEVLEAAAHRDGSQLTFDAKVKNTGERMANELVIIVDVLDFTRK